MTAKDDLLDLPTEEVMSPAQYVAKHATVTQLTWIPGHPTIIDNALMDENGSFEPRAGMRIANLYTEPRHVDGDPAKAARWADLLRKLYPEEAEEVLDCFAQRVQRPHEKINRALVLAGPPGIGKDSLLEPLVQAVGEANVREVGPTDLYSAFTEYLQSVIVRVSESHDLGEHSRNSFYEKGKRLIAVPPHSFDVNSKYMRKYRIRNVTFLIFTSNHEGGGLFIPADDRRHFVLWTEVTQADFQANYFRDLWLWYHDEGFRHIAAFLRARDISHFDAKAPPPKTASFLRVALSNAEPGSSLFEEAVTAIGRPLATTFEAVARQIKLQEPEAGKAFVDSIANKGRLISRLMRSVGYVAILRHPGEGKPDQRWKVNGRNTTIFGRMGAPDSRLRGEAARLAKGREDGDDLLT